MHWQGRGIGRSEYRDIVRTWVYICIALEEIGVPEMSTARRHLATAGQIMLVRMVLWSLRLWLSSQMILGNSPSRSFRFLAAILYEMMTMLRCGILDGSFFLMSCMYVRRFLSWMALMCWITFSLADP